MTTACKHPQVRVVARQDDVEFVECQSCREVFDAAEYADMVTEEEEQADSLDKTAIESSRLAPKAR